MCDAWTPAARIGYTLAAVLVLGLTLALPVWLLVRSKGDRPPIAALWALTLVIGPMALVVNDLVQGGSWAERWWGAGVVLGLALGLVAGLIRHRRRVTFALVGFVGAAGFPAMLYALFVGSLAATGTCLD